MGLQYSLVTFAFLIVSNIGMQIGAHMRENIYLLFLALSALTGSIGGWASARLYKFFNGTYWKLHTVTTILAVPMLALFVLSIMTSLESLETNRFGERRSASFDKILIIWALFDMLNVAIGCWLGL